MIKSHKDWLLLLLSIPSIVFVLLSLSTVGLFAGLSLGITYLPYLVFLAILYVLLQKTNNKLAKDTLYICIAVMLILYSIFVFAV